MEFREFGTGNETVMMFLHGGGLSWWNFRDEAELLKDEYCVILPVLDGPAELLIDLAVEALLHHLVIKKL